MKAKPPRKRRKSSNDWNEVEYLYQKLIYWLYGRDDSGKAAPYAERLARLLPVVDPAHDAILGEECWSLIYQTRSDIPKAIAYRESEVRLMRRLHELCPDPESASDSFALQGRGYGDLSDRLDLLATLYRASGKLDRAITLLRESKRLCEEHGIAFDGGDLLDEYLTEQRSSP